MEYVHACTGRDVGLDYEEKEDQDALGEGENRENFHVLFWGELEARDLLQMRVDCPVLEAPDEGQEVGQESVLPPEDENAR